MTSQELLELQAQRVRERQAIAAPPQPQSPSLSPFVVAGPPPMSDIVSMMVTQNGDLAVMYDDGRAENAGSVVGPPGPQGALACPVWLAHAALMATLS